jgi:hypothetical protein
VCTPTLPSVLALTSGVTTSFTSVRHKADRVEPS